MKQLLIRLLILLLLAASCRKDVTFPAEGAGAQISFVCASAQLQNELKAEGAFSFIVSGIADTGYAYPSANAPVFPYFSRNQNYQYPNTTFNAKQNQPWIWYMSIPRGSHQFILVDTAHHPLVQHDLQAQPGQLLSVYYADSLGYFRTWTLSDERAGNATGIRLRFLHLSPDAGKIFCTINEKAGGAGFPDSLHYGETTGFIPYDSPVIDTLRISFYQAQDSANAIARVFLQAEPGRSYTLALQGYQYDQGYLDPHTGGFFFIPAGLRVLINKNF